jgi:molecular chaperone DnaJ
MPKDYYKILGVNKTATEADVKKSFRKLAHQHHPDKTNGSAEKFKEINEAYQVLGNKEKRQQYDQFGQTFDSRGGFGGGNPFSQGSSTGWDFRGFGGQGFGDAQNMDFDLGDIFSSFFGGGGVSRGGRRSRRGSDVAVDLDISLKEAVFGVSQVIYLRKQMNCEACSGTGAKDGTSYEICQTCGGSGQVATTILGQFRTQTVCPDCHGQGKAIKIKCSHCHGQGVTTENVDLKVEIPAGIDDGQSVKLSGQGNKGKSGAGAGDLFINVHVRPEGGFKREGFDLITEQEIPFTLAVLGGEIKVKTIDGQVKLKIPAGTPSGQKFILKGQGVTRLRSRGRGDQIVIVNVEVPTKLTKKQKHLIEELNEELINKKDSWF